MHACVRDAFCAARVDSEELENANDDESDEEHEEDEGDEGDEGGEGGVEGDEEPPSLVDAEAKVVSPTSVLTPVEIVERMSQLEDQVIAIACHLLSPRPLPSGDR